MHDTIPAWLATGSGRATARRLLRRLDPRRPDLAPVLATSRAGDDAGACSALLDHFQAVPVESRFPASMPRHVHFFDRDAGAVMNREFERYTATGKDTTPHPARDDEGSLDWAWRGPDNDKEYAYRVHRFFWVPALMAAFAMNGNEGAVACFNERVADWIAVHPRPLVLQESVSWRPMEAALRAWTWSRAFFAFRDSPAFTPVTRLLVLDSIVTHASYLQRWHRLYTGNHLLCHLAGLATIAIAFPELARVDRWLATARATAARELLRRQVYPDGVHAECSAHIHAMSVQYFHYIAGACTSQGIDMPAGYHDRLELAWDYLFRSLQPGGQLPMNNDCPLDPVDWRPLLGEVARHHGRQDWIHVASGGTSGTMPGPTRVHFFPRGGQAIIRNGWTPASHWLFFDAGPAGILPSHVHKDCLHVSLSAFGREFLVDSNFYHHVRDEWRNGYFNSSRGHNVMLVDGLGQKARRRRSKGGNGNNGMPAWQQVDGVDVVTGRFDGGFAMDVPGTRCGSKNPVKGSCIHDRAVIDMGRDAWIIMDWIDTDRPRDLAFPWHFHPDCSLAGDGEGVVTRDESKPNLRLVPASTAPLHLSLVSGQGPPGIQGWHAPAYKQKVPAPCASWSGRAPGPVLACWTLVAAPAGREVPGIEARVDDGGDGRFTLRVAAGDAMNVDASIDCRQGLRVSAVQCN